MKHSFGSDNHAPVATPILEAIIEANRGFAVAYGQDPLTLKVESLFQELFGADSALFLVQNGTGANVLALNALSKSYYSILAPATSHINVDECGAVEKFIGCRVTPLPHIDGKLYPSHLRSALKGFGSPHNSQPLIVSISQPTELGTLYTSNEIKELADLIHSYGGLLHIDGSRISNAAAALGLEIRQFTKECGADALSFGGTKNGMLIGEAVVLFNRPNRKESEFYRKQATQLLSKQRYLAAQFLAYFNNSLHLKLAQHANSMAQYLKELLERDVPQVTITRPVETNAVFAKIPIDITEKLMAKHHFYIWDEQQNEVRWMCSHATEKADIELFIKDIKELIYLTA